ncbi:hypothetical protein BDF21DRAFT_321109, partial [Thamnidium elegans]
VTNHAQVTQFLNLAFLPDDPENKEVYVQKSLINNEIFSTVWKYTDLFDEKPAIGFNQWCTNKVDFATVKTKRKNQDSGKLSIRSLFVAK